ncbi:MAG: chitobiase/beta-hexosaminidase C-terminal domain-containing protein [Phycisphaerae bacterium]
MKTKMILLVMFLVGALESPSPATVTNFSSGMDDKTGWTAVEGGDAGYTAGIDMLGDRTGHHLSGSATSQRQAFLDTPLNSGPGFTLTLGFDVMLHNFLAAVNEPVSRVGLLTSGGVSAHAGQLAQAWLTLRRQGSIELQVLRYTDEIGTTEAIVNTSASMPSGNATGISGYNYASWTMTRDSNGMWTVSVLNAYGNIVLSFGTTESTVATSCGLDKVYIQDLYPTNNWDGSEAAVYWDNISVSSDLTAPPLSAATPVFYPDGGYIPEATLVTLTCETSGALIYYTLDNTTPTESNDNCFSGGYVLVEPGQTLMARAFAPGYYPSLVKTAEYKSLNRPIDITRADGSVTVDGNLSEWQDDEFVPLDTPFYGTSQLDNASYAVRWDGTTDQFYVAVKVKDTHPIFEDSYVDWDKQDGIEVYLHTTGGEPYNYYSDPNQFQSTAQQYVLGLKATRTGTDTTQHVWVTHAGVMAVDREKVGFQAAGVKADDWLFYEVKMTAYEYLNLTGDNSTISPLNINDIVGVDVTVCDKWGTGENDFGMMAENNVVNKYTDWRKIGLHKLAGPMFYTLTGTVALQGWTASLAGIPVVVQLQDQADMSISGSVTKTLDADGKFTMVIRAGMYNVRVKASHWLSDVTSDVDMTAADGAASFSLVNGDCNGDNAVNSGDLSLLLMDMDSIPGDPSCDLDGDAEITSTDLSINLLYQEQVGDEF